MVLKKRLISAFVPVLAFCSWMMTNESNGNIFSFNRDLCLNQFHQETAPELINPKLKNQTYPLCYQGFSLNYSGISKTPLWVAEKLTPQRLAQKIKREDNFHVETRLPINARALLEDYRGSGYDRGHMAPNGDMGDKVSQYDSFSLANIIPQAPDNNQNTWREIEEATRAMVSKYKLDAYVVTGPAYLNSKVKYIKKGRAVLVPSHVYKVVYFPKIGMASAYLSTNDSRRSAKIISICALEEMIGINIFPQAAENIKRQIYALPMQANKVKANQQPKFLQNDLISQCAPDISADQIKTTQKQFIVGKNYASGLDLSIPSVQKQQNPNTSPLDEQLDQINQQQDKLSNLNKILLPLLRWLKQQE
ncbi:DNA/RNA non-specific endonuclease [Acinetobacter populi]|uniref:Endonuclease n=1 Tax=Acinetobacter populi TaxID=1582270 RepID=A0A1Z9Z3N9_9GAMM|nr:DNA/RNA non-specific endonuclease [Acinetobacter populi]OUY09076.1 hypothetical protein CAP51_05625 [Acinetobacter populi]